jgi:polar amino acid transport system substrate-binding protein
MKTVRRTAIVVFAITLALATACNNKPELTGSNNQTPPRTETALARILRTKHVTIGFAGYPPYLRRDPNTGAMSGYSVELAHQIFDPLSVTIDWKETTWDTMKQDLLLGKFDLMVEPIFFTLPRAAQVGYTRPYAYFGYGVPVLRKGDNRYKSVMDLNKEGVVLAITQGVTDQEFAARTLPRARVKLIPGNDITITLTEVLTGKVDAALADVPTVLSFVKAHPNQVVALRINDPPAISPAGFIAKPEEVQLLNFLNTALSMLEAQGVFDALETRYELPSFRERKQWVVGRALNQ